MSHGQNLKKLAIFGDCHFSPTISKKGIMYTYTYKFFANIFFGFSPASGWKIMRDAMSCMQLDHGCYPIAALADLIEVAHILAVMADLSTFEPWQVQLVTGYYDWAFFSGGP